MQLKYHSHLADDFSSGNLSYAILSPIHRYLILQDFAPQIIDCNKSTCTSSPNAAVKNCLLNSTEHWQ